MASSKQTLSIDELQTLLAQQPEWTVREGRLVREWEFADFAGAMRFVNEVAALAEEANHHPDIDIRYNRVQLALVSHDAGGITSRDAGMAAKLSATPVPGRSGAA